MGYHSDRFGLYPSSACASPTFSSLPSPSSALPTSSASKKLKKCELGSDKDWQAALGSGQHREGGHGLSQLLGEAG